MSIKLDHCVIYKIRCRDEAITDLYIGQTFNYPARVANHKSNCNNPNSIQYNNKLYKTIRSTGGFNNWKFEIVETFSDCKSIDEARNKERYYIELLHANLNNNRPIITPEEKKEQLKEYVKEYQQGEKYKQYQQGDKYKQYQKEYQKQYREKHKLKKQEQQPANTTYNVQNMTINNYNNDSTA